MGLGRLAAARGGVQRGVIGASEGEGMPVVVMLCYWPESKEISPL